VLADAFLIGQSGTVRLHPEIVAPLVGMTTRRLTLRPLGRDDLDALTVLCAHAELWEFEQGRGLTSEETAEFLDRQLKLWDEYGFGGRSVRAAEGPTELLGVVGLAVPVIFEPFLPPLSTATP
jgi:RimJ/RimL family protein N-acetyltransferase